jgi:hypothetical protein
VAQPVLGRLGVPGLGVRAASVFANLRSYLEHLAGQPVRNVVAMAYTSGSAAGAWPRQYRAPGLPGRPAVGDTVTRSRTRFHLFVPDLDR